MSRRYRGGDDDGERKDEYTGPEFDAYELGARVLAVAGAFGATVVIAVPANVAEHWFPIGLAQSGRTEPVEAVEKDLEALAERSPELAGSGEAATALQMALELVNPYNSATSKSMCAGKLLDALNVLRGLAPPEEKKGALHAIRGGRADRLSEGASGT